METIHFTQQTFRDVLDCFATPGKMRQLQSRRSVEDYYSATLSVLETLVDSEVSIYMTNSNVSSQTAIKMYTGATTTKVDHADFIVVGHKTDLQQALKAIEQAKIGTLIDPHKSATIVMELRDDQYHSYEMSGPGMKEPFIIELPLSKEVINLRNKKNVEFPLGIDFIFINEQNEVIALPRTTSMKEVNL